MTDRNALRPVKLDSIDADVHAVSRAAERIAEDEPDATGDGQGAGPDSETPAGP